MTAAQLERIQEHLQRLRLFKSRERLEALLQEASTQELSYADFLDQVLTEEVTAKTAKHITMRTSLARFPFVKGLESFEFGYQPSVDRKQIQTLSTCRFIEHGENVILLGPPGVGKTLGGGPRAEGDRARVSGALHNGRGDADDAEQGARRCASRRQVEGLYGAAPLDHR